MSNLLSGLAIVTAFAVGDGHTPDHITASGLHVRPGVTVACPRELELGSWVWIESIGLRRCDDRYHVRYEGAEPPYFDVAVCSPEGARRHGRRTLLWRPLVRTTPDAE